MRLEHCLPALVLLLLAAAPPAHASETGRQLIQKNCGSCHAVGLEDRSPLPVAPPFRDVAKRYPPDNLAEALAEGIVTGHEGMPEFVFEPVQIVAIVDYLKSLRGN
jgi:mono/diheme cytochrome c family protein